MNKLFFKLAFRNILKNKFHSLISAFGFSIGIATTLFIILFLNFETNFDAFHPDAKRLYRVTTIDQNKDGISTSGFCFYPVVSEMKNEIPGIEDYCRVSAFNRGKFTINQQVQSIEKCRMVDADFLNCFDIKLTSGRSFYDDLGWVFIAFIVACPTAYGVMNKWLENFVYKTELSWWVFALAGLIAFGIALVTVSWQSWRAASRNPVEALRYE